MIVCSTHLSLVESILADYMFLETSPFHFIGCPICLHGSFHSTLLWFFFSISVVSVVVSFFHFLFYLGLSSSWCTYLKVWQFYLSKKSTLDFTAIFYFLGLFYLFLLWFFSHLYYFFPSADFVFLFLIPLDIKLGCLFEMFLVLETGLITINFLLRTAFCCIP